MKSGIYSSLITKELQGFKTFIDHGDDKALNLLKAASQSTHNQGPVAIAGTETNTTVLSTEVHCNFHKNLIIYI